MDLTEGRQAMLPAQPPVRQSELLGQGFLTPACPDQLAYLQHLKLRSARVMLIRAFFFGKGRATSHRAMWRSVREVEATHRGCKELLLLHQNSWH